MEHKYLNMPENKQDMKQLHYISIYEILFLPQSVLKLIFQGDNMKD